MKNARSFRVKWPSVILGSQGLWRFALRARVIVWVKWNGGHLVGLNHSHNVQNNRGENGSQYTIGNETKASESPIFSPVFHST